MKFTNYCMLSNTKTEYEIIIKRDRVILKVDDKTPWNEDVMYEYIKKCINMDEWQHSWHIDISDAKKKPEIKRKLKDIVKEKISNRKKDIEWLEFCLKVLRRYTYKAIMENR